MFGNIPPFFTNIGPASATQPGILTGPGTTQQVGGNKEWTNQVANQGTLAKWTPAAYLALPASTENPDINFALNRTVQFATGALALQRAYLVQAPTYAFVGASTLSDAATFAVSGPPVASTNATITKTWSAVFGTPGATTIPQQGNMVGIFAAGSASLVNRNTSNSVEGALTTGTSAVFVGATTAHGLNLITNNATRMSFGSTGAANVAVSLSVGASGTALTQIKVYTQTITPASVAANTTAEQDFTVTGLTTADTVDFNPGAAPTAGTGIVGWRVKAADTLSVTYCNNTAGALTPSSGTARIVATRS